MQQRTIDKLRKKLTKERKRRSKIQGKLKLSQEQSLQLQEALNAANKENERLETAREAQVLHKTNFTNTRTFQCEMQNGTDVEINITIHLRVGSMRESV